MTSDDIRLSPTRITRDLRGVSRQPGTTDHATVCEMTAAIVPARGRELREDGREADLGTDVTATATATAGETEIRTGTDEAQGTERGAPAETDIMIGEVCITFYMRMSPDRI